MQKNWYIVYTKTGYEKKVVTSFQKKKIECYLPLNNSSSSIGSQQRSFKKRKLQAVPLFNSYVFVYVEDYFIQKIVSIDGVLNLVYWKGLPAIIQSEEVDIIKEFTSDYSNIKLEKTAVLLKNNIRIINDPQYSIDGNFLSIKNSTIKAILPSLGFTLIAEIESENLLQTNLLFENKRRILSQS